MPLPKVLDGNSWSHNTARKIFPWLIWLAKNGKSVFYGDIHQELLGRKVDKLKGCRKYGAPLGLIGDAVLEIGTKLKLENVPPVNVLAINATNKYPGQGCDLYLERFLGCRWDDLTKADKRSVTENSVADRLCRLRLPISFELQTRRSFRNDPQSAV